MKLEQDYIQPVYQILVKLMCESGNEHGSHIMVEKIKLLNWCRQLGANGDMEKLEECVQHMSETPFGVTNSTGSYTLPFIDEYEDKDGYFFISFHQKYLQEFVRKIVEIAAKKNNIS